MPPIFNLKWEGYKNIHGETYLNSESCKRVTYLITSLIRIMNVYKNNSFVKFSYKTTEIITSLQTWL